MWSNSCFLFSTSALRNLRNVERRWRSSPNPTRRPDLRGGHDGWMQSSVRCSVASALPLMFRTLLFQLFRSVPAHSLQILWRRCAGLLSRFLYSQILITPSSRLTVLVSFLCCFFPGTIPGHCVRWDSHHYGYGMLRSTQSDLFSCVYKVQAPVVVTSQKMKNLSLHVTHLFMTVLWMIHSTFKIILLYRYFGVF